MTDWLKRYWILLTVGLVIVFLAYGGIAGIVSGIGYQKQIRASDKEITSLKKKIKASDTKADAAIDRARVAEEQARIERAEKEKHKARAARIEEEKKELRDKIATLPPTQIVVYTIKILHVGPEEITLQPQGVVFTLVAARKNLEFLKTFTLVKKQYSEIQLSLAKSEASEVKLLKANAEKDIAIAEKDGQLAGWVGAEVEWNNKFNNSENRRKEARAKGRKEGGIAGGIIVAIMWFFVGK